MRLTSLDCKILKVDLFRQYNPDGICFKANPIFPFTTCDRLVDREAQGSHELKLRVSG
jgi:hypothetical protein